MTPDKMPISKLSLGEYLALARELKGWSLRDLEKRTGISNALISQIEHGDVKEPGFIRWCGWRALSGLGSIALRKPRSPRATTELDEPMASVRWLT